MKIVAPDGKPVVSLPNPDIPDAVILELDRLRNEENLSLEDAVTNIRGHQVPAGHSPYPFRRDTRESLLDKLRSVVATCRFRANIEYWKERGADFSSHLYVPESDPVTEEERHDRGDHNHLFRRMAKSVREGKDPKLNFEAFNDALHDPECTDWKKKTIFEGCRTTSIHPRCRFFEEERPCSRGQTCAAHGELARSLRWSWPVSAEACPI